MYIDYIISTPVIDVINVNWMSLAILNFPLGLRNDAVNGLVIASIT